MCQKEDTMQVPYWWPRDLKLPMSVTVIWCSLLGTCELIHIFVLSENSSNYVENIRHHLTKFSCSENIGHHHKNLVSLTILGTTIQNSVVLTTLGITIQNLATPKLFEHHHTRCSWPENIRHHRHMAVKSHLLLILCVVCRLCEKSLLACTSRLWYVACGS